VPADPLSLDTAPEIERRQVAGWSRMSAAEKAAMVTALTKAAFDMTLAGIRHRHPGESPRMLRGRLAALLHGPELAKRMFPDLDLS